MGRNAQSDNLFYWRPLFAQNATKRLFRGFKRMGIPEPEASGLYWSFQWKEFVMNRNNVKAFGKFINIETAFLTSKCEAQGYPIFFQKYQI